MNTSLESTKYPVGELLQLGIRVHNSLSRPLAGIMLQLYFFQDYQNGTVNQQLEPCLATVGATEVNFPKVSVHTIAKSCG